MANNNQDWTGRYWQYL